MSIEAACWPHQDRSATLPGMAHFTFCWELGGGLGHAGRIRSLAQPLVARGHRVSLVLRDLVLTRTLLADLALPCYQAPVWLHRTAGLPPEPASLAEILLGCGYLDAGALAGLVDGWCALFSLDRPDLVIADYAPTALLAARSMGIGSASVGPGFYMPPAHAPLPQLALHGELPASRLAAGEQRLLASCNAVLAAHGAPPFAHGADLLLGDHALLCTWPELDHYGRGGPGPWLGPNLSAGGGAAPEWPPGEGPRAFVYLSRNGEADGACLAALVRQGCRVLCYAPAIAAGKAPPFAAPALRYARAPVALEQVFAQCELFVGVAGESSVTRALLAGVPALLMPHSAESFMLARRVRQLGAGINVAETSRPHDWDGMVRALLDAPGYRAAARAFAVRYADYRPGEQARMLAGRCEQLARS